MQKWDSDFDAALRQVIPPHRHELIEPDVELTSLGLDSMGAVQLVTLLEDRYDIVFPIGHLTDQPATPQSVWSAVTNARSGAR
jgi:acyl carrier protein